LATSSSSWKDLPTLLFHEKEQYKAFYLEIQRGNDNLIGMASKYHK
jgi:hypothetical protein